MGGASVGNRHVVALCTDARFFLPCAFLVEQLAKDPRRASYDVAIAHVGVPDAELKRLEARAGPILTFSLETEAARMAVGAQDSHMLHPTYFRLLLHRLLPPHYERILYLDSDIYVERHEIADLFALPLGGAALAAARCGLYVGLLCPEAAPNLPALRREREKTVAYITGLGLDLGDPYLNAGVLLIDRARWVGLDIPGRAVEFARAFPERCMLFDQSAINAVGKGQWVELSPRWNFQGIHTMGELDDALRPVFRHFAGPFKPWNTDAWGHGLARAYHDWLGASGWSGRFPDGPTGDEGLTRKKSRRRRWRWFGSAGKTAREAPLTARDRFGAERRAAVRHAVTAIMTFATFVDLDEDARRALVRAVIETRGAPAVSASPGARA